jgi:hypothetical protein
MEQLQVLEESLRDPDIYYQCVSHKIYIKLWLRLTGFVQLGWDDSFLGKSLIRDALKRAWYRVFSIKMMASVNWEGNIKKGSMQKQGLKQLICTKAVFGRLCV